MCECTCTHTHIKNTHKNENITIWKSENLTLRQKGFTKDEKPFVMSLIFPKDHKIIDDIKRIYNFCLENSH